MKASLLLIIPFAPYPSRSGGQSRLQATIPLLAKHYQIHLVELRPLDFVETPELRAFYQQYCQTVSIVERFTKQHFSYFFTGIPYWFSDYWNPELAWLLPQMLADYRIDLVQIEFSQLLYVRNFLPKTVKTRFIAHDIATLSFWRRLLEEKKLWKWPIHLLRFFEVAAFEKKYLSKISSIVAVSELDQQYLQKSFPSKKILLQRNGINQLHFLEKRQSKEIRLGFIGSIEHSPNQGAIAEILRILPQLNTKTDQSVSFYLAGKNSAADLNKLFGQKAGNIHNLGELANSQNFYENIDLLFAPLKSGSGSRMKILESLSFGRPVVASSIAAEGLKIKTEFLQVVTDGKWSTAIQKAKQLELNSKNTAELQQALQSYLWQKQDIDEG
jgi:glycosyltransferase involved in cell wall biosynthesis